MDALTAIGRIVVTGLLAACGPQAAGAPGLPGPPGAGGAGECPPTPGQEVLARVNAIRASHGLAALRPHPELIAAARAHSDDQAAHGRLSHLGSDGSVASERIEAAGYRWSMTGENVAAGYDTPARVVAGWMDSPPHRAILLAPQPVHAGVALTTVTGDAPGWFWTLNVARPGPSEGTPSQRCHP